MFPGRHAGYRTLQGLTTKAQVEKLCAAAERQQERYARSGQRNWRIKTLQNLACAAAITIASTVAGKLALDPAPRALKWPAVCLAVTAVISNFILATRRHAEKAAAHSQIAKRYAALAASCRASVTKYEANQVEDNALQSLLDQHAAEMNALERDRGAA